MFLVGRYRGELSLESHQARPKCSSLGKKGCWYLHVTGCVQQTSVPNTYCKSCCVLLSRQSTIVGPVHVCVHQTHTVHFHRMSRVKHRISGHPSALDQSVYRRLAKAKLSILDPVNSRSQDEQLNGLSRLAEWQQLHNTTSWNWM